MRRFAFFTVAALASVAAFGQSLLDCIEPDVLRALLLQSQGERPPVITAAVPAEVSALKMSREFTWIGSAERITGRVDATNNASQVTAAWRSSLTPDAARAATATALTASGWEVRAQQGMGILSVFNSGAPQPAQAACREGKPVNFNTSAMDGVTYVLFTIQRGNNLNSICSQPERFETVSNTGLEKYMPHLDLPADSATGAVPRTQGSSGNSGTGNANVRTEFSMKDSAANIAKHFAKQMAEQGWTSDANWSGTTTAGSSWTKRDASTLVQGMLTITAVDEQQRVVMLRVRTLQ